MTEHSKVDAVASGRPYEVSAVNGHPPLELRDFLRTDPIAVAARAGVQDVLICGSATDHGDEVTLYEKDGGTGKDVRTWTISDGGDGFVAVERSTF
jgi:hypothetical protein